MDDDVVSLYGDHDIDQADHSVNHKNDGPYDPEYDADQGKSIFKINAISRVIRS